MVYGFVLVWFFFVGGFELVLVVVVVEGYFDKVWVRLIGVCVVYWFIWFVSVGFIF